MWDEVKDRLRESALGLSGGQHQRLCIARAIAVDPQIITSAAIATIGLLVLLTAVVFITRNISEAQVRGLIEAVRKIA